jgi:putative sterol carrier protein
MKDYVTLRCLTGRKKCDVGDTFKRMAELLKDSEDDGSIQFRILNKDQHLYWNLLLHPNGCHVRPEKIDKPDLEIITKEETWRQIAEGKLSPLVAFVRHKMRIRGNEKLGKRILKQLASSEGKIDIC